MHFDCFNFDWENFFPFHICFPLSFSFFISIYVAQAANSSELRVLMVPLSWFTMVRRSPSAWGKIHFSHFNKKNRLETFVLGRRMSFGWSKRVREMKTGSGTDWMVCWNKDEMRNIHKRPSFHSMMNMAANKASTTSRIFRVKKWISCISFISTLPSSLLYTYSHIAADSDEEEKLCWCKERWRKVKNSDTKSFLHSFRFLRFNKYILRLSDCFFFSCTFQHIKSQLKDESMNKTHPHAFIGSSIFSQPFPHVPCRVLLIFVVCSAKLLYINKVVQF